ncbi:hypothetical protein AVEN_118060-1, partial [Araneus ventricosus]
RGHQKILQPSSKYSTTIGLSRTSWVVEWIGINVQLIVNTRGSSKDSTTIIKILYNHCDESNLLGYGMDRNQCAIDCKYLGVIKRLYNIIKRLYNIIKILYNHCDESTLLGYGMEWNQCAIDCKYPGVIKILYNHCDESTLLGYGMESMCNTAHQTFVQILFPNRYKSFTKQMQKPV